MVRGSTLSQAASWEIPASSEKKSKLVSKSRYKDILNKWVEGFKK